MSNNENEKAILIDRMITDTIEGVKAFTELHGNSRELALTRTKLEEAQMWFAKR